MNTFRTSKWVTVIILVVMLAFICCQWLPYYSDGSGGSISLATYFAFPVDHEDVTQNLTAQLGSFNIYDVLFTGLLLPLVGFILGLVLLFKRENTIVIGLTGVWGLWGVIGYCFNAGLRLGGGVRFLYIAMCAVVFLAALWHVLAVIHESREEAQMLADDKKHQDSKPVLSA